MRDQLVGYLLNCLDESTHRAVETHLQRDPESRRQLENLRAALAPLSADRADPEPPYDLAGRTIRRLAGYTTPVTSGAAANGAATRNGAAATLAQPAALPRAPRTPRTYAGDRSLWRRADLLVAASLLLLVAGLTTLAVVHIRKTSVLMACQDNLREFHGALAAYHQQHGHFPNVAAQHPRAVAGLAVPMLIKAGCLPAEANVRCPENGPAATLPLTLEEILSLPDEEFARQAPALVNCYAYSLGYYKQGIYYGPRYPAKKGKAGMPLMADRPAVDVRSGNSPNHGGRGQNVLFHDGHVNFLKKRLVGGDDFYLNKANRDAAGLDEADAVLGSSAAKP